MATQVPVMSVAEAVNPRTTATTNTTSHNTRMQVLADRRCAMAARIAAGLVSQDPLATPPAAHVALAHTPVPRAATIAPISCGTCTLTTDHTTCRGPGEVP
ncbi:MAG: hypothetical protein IPH81_12765 [Candidatus Microthrix sp.]|nr:hypothetical protein [Candidatus Microthrix sp.]